MKNLFTLLFAMLMLTRVEAQLVAWNFSGATGNEATQASNVGHGNMEISTLSRGSGVAASAANSAFSSVWPEISTQTANCYYEFTVKAKTGYVASLSSIDVKLRIQNNGPKTYIWKYSLDGGENFTDIGIPYTWTNAADLNNNDGVQQPQVDLSSIAELQNLPSSQPVVFRIYAWNSGNATSVFRIGRSLSTSEHALVIGGSVASELPTVVAWNLKGAAGNEATSVSNIGNENMQPSILSRGSGITASTAGDSYASTWPLISAQDENSYYEFTVAPKPGYIVSLHALDVKFRIQNAAPKTYIWKYSVDGGANFVDIGTPYTWTSSIDLNNNDGVHQPARNLSGISALQNITPEQPVVFRIYAWGSTNATSGFRIGKSLTTSEHALTLSGTVQTESTTPVKLTSFKGKTVGNMVKLNWTTGSEQNNSFFEILRSSTDKPTTVIGKITGNGTSNIIHDYNFTDNAPLLGVNYYQLRQVDYDGKSELSEIIAVATDLNRTNMSITASEMEIRASVYSLINSQAKLYISDLSGKLLLSTSMVLNGNGNNTFTVPFTATKGIYVALLTMDDGTRLSTKFYK